MISFINEGLTDLSVTRSSFDWGIKVPFDEKHVVYVLLKKEQIFYINGEMMNIFLQEINSLETYIMSSTTALTIRSARWRDRHSLQL